jgi:hypothetical protein
MTELAHKQPCLELPFLTTPNSGDGDPYFQLTRRERGSQPANIAKKPLGKKVSSSIAGGAKFTAGKPTKPQQESAASKEGIGVASFFSASFSLSHPALEAWSLGDSNP